MKGPLQDTCQQGDACMCKSVFMYMEARGQPQALLLRTSSNMNRHLGFFVSRFCCLVGFFCLLVLLFDFVLVFEKKISLYSPCRPGYHQTYKDLLSFVSVSHI